MTETLRDKEELLRIENESVRKAREELVLLRRKVETHDEIMSEKDRGVQVRFEDCFLPQQGSFHGNSLTDLASEPIRCCMTKSNHSTWNSIK